MIQSDTGAVKKRIQVSSQAGSKCFAVRPLTTFNCSDLGTIFELDCRRDLAGLRLKCLPF